MSHQEHNPSTTGTTVHQRRTRQQQSQQQQSLSTGEGGGGSSPYSQTANPAIGLGVIPPTPTRDQHLYPSQTQTQSQRVTLPPIRIPDIDQHHQYDSRPSSSNSTGGHGFYPHQQARSTSSTTATATADPYTGTRHLPHPVSSPGQPHFLPPSANSYFHPNLPLSTSTSPLSIDGRILRSPHPPLTALLNPSNIDHTGSNLAAQAQYRASHFLAQQQLLHPQTHTHAQENQHLRPSHHLHRPYHTLSPLDHPLSSPLLQSTFTAPPHLPPASTSAQHRASPVLIPPPLRFNYSATPPEPSPNTLAHQPYGNAGPSSGPINSNASIRAQYFPEFLIPAMPPRRKAAGAGTTTTNMTVSATPQTVSSAASSTRPRKGAKGNGWTTEHTYDSVGQKREVIVIDDSQTPEHPPRKRTRAQVAAENAAAAAAASGGSAGTYARSHGSQNGHLPNGYAPSVASTSSAGKKRKVDEGADTAAKKKGKASGTAASTQTAPRAPPVQPVQPNQPNTWDDAEGHFIVKPEDIIGSKYKIVRLLGQGTFGKVVEARHIESRRKVAIKVIRAVQKYRDASKIEIRVLETLRRHDPTNSFKCIHLDEYFDYRNHPCIVSELYGMSVFDFLKQNSFSPFPERHIQDFARSLLKSVDFLHRLKLVHTDLKPENILLVSNGAELAGPRRAGAKSRAILRNTDIRLIDFGSATFENEYHSSVVSTRHYRAPEIILGLPWSYPCDMFSIGCILVEFFTGDALFQTHDNLEHLAMMEVVMGRMPSRMIDKGRLKKPEFFKSGKIDFPNSSVSRSSRKYVKTMKTLAQIIPPTNSHNKLFLDLIERLLDFDPDTRLTVDKALDHPYLRVQTPEPIPAGTVPT